MVNNIINFFAYNQIMTSLISNETEPFNRLSVTILKEMKTIGKINVNAAIFFYCVIFNEKIMKMY